MLALEQSLTMAKCIHINEDNKCMPTHTHCTHMHDMHACIGAQHETIQRNVVVCEYTYKHSDMFLLFLQQHVSLQTFTKYSLGCMRFKLYGQRPLTVLIYVDGSLHHLRLTSTPPVDICYWPQWSVSLSFCEPCLKPTILFRSAILL